MELPRASLGSVNSTVRSPTLSDTSSPASIGGRPLIQGSISQHSSSGEILGKHFQAPLIPRAPSRSKEHNHEREALMRQQHAEYIKKQRTISEKIRQEIAMKKAVEAFQQKIVVDVRSSSPHGSKVGALAGSKPDAEEAYLRKEFAKLEGFLIADAGISRAATSPVTIAPAPLSVDVRGSVPATLLSADALSVHSAGSSSYDGRSSRSISLSAVPASAGVTLGQLQESHATISGFFTILEQDGSAWTPCFFLLTDEANVYAFPPHAVGPHCAPHRILSIRKCVPVYDRGSWMLSFQGDKRTWFVGVPDERTATTWTVTATRICEAVQDAAVARQGSLDYSRGRQFSAAPTLVPVSVPLPASPATSARVLSGTSRSSSVSASRTREARMKEQHEEYLARQRELSEKVKQEIAVKQEQAVQMKRSMEISRKKQEDVFLQKETEKLRGFLF
ncbi:hypothetical protein HDU84_003924 [Entophlyctis sp. JEL0112]|nr:hypothetical protein HDU84_003924 [Entophlyctis sp. JEL0112]